MIRLSTILIILLFTIHSDAQRKKKPDMHVIEFVDKQHSAYSIYRPWEFLSPRAIQRRKRNGIPITTSDLPVNDNYLDKIRNTGARIHSTSKWLNSALIIIDKERLSLDEIKKMEFVKSTFPVGYYRKAPKRKEPQRVLPKAYDPYGDRYGFAGPQIRMTIGHILHWLGYEGQGKQVAVLDGGFTQADVMPFFDSLKIHNRLLPSKDIVHSDNYAYESSSHGSQVLSTMAANLPGLMVGTAPSAEYICIKTEEIGAENPVEEEYWIRGLEHADSLGIDVVNSSLGYTTFDLKDLNHIKEKLDGISYRASQAANIAAEKGILVVNSAGNEGNGSWKKIGVPADAELILTVGAVNINGDKAGFSSFGPTADGRIKPEVSVMGERAAVADLHDYQVNGSNGTSFSSPILAGLATSLWSAFPERSNMEIRDAIIRSSHQAALPDTLLGYGIPDMTKAFAFLSGIETHHRFDPGSRILILDNNLQVFFPRDTNAETAFYRLHDAFGRTITEGTQYQYLPLGYLEVPDLQISLTPGVYSLLIQSGQISMRIHFVKTE